MKRRILVFGLTENPGGVENFLRNYIRHMDRELLQFDFLCNFHGKAAYEDEFAAAGAAFYHITARSCSCRKYHAEIRRFFRENASDYDAIWVNVSSLANIDYLKYAKKYGIPRRIIHSHNTRNMDGALRGALHRLGRWEIGRYATDFWACSEEAADWFYIGRARRGAGCRSCTDRVRSRAVIVRNAIEVERFAFSGEDRRRLRRELGLGERFVVGHVGRFHFQKNQEFVLRVFAEILRLEPDARLVLVGGGEDEAGLRRIAGDMGLEGHVVWAGVQRDVGPWLSAMDLFLFPSLFEGLSVVALEAQANGLPVLASEQAVPEEACLTARCVRMELARPAAEWAEAALASAARERGTAEAALASAAREQGTAEGGGLFLRSEAGRLRAIFRDAGFDIETEAGRLAAMLLEMPGE